MPARIPDEQLADRIRHAAADLGYVPRAQEVHGHMAAIRRWGTWNAALAAAGLAPRRPYSDDDLLALLRGLYAREGRVALRLISEDPNLPHSRVYLRRWGTLPAAVAAAGLPPGAVQASPGTFNGRLDSHLRRTFGIGVSDYLDMLEAQGGFCASCGEPPHPPEGKGRHTRLDVDHCHETGKVRGLLCNRCNRMAGMAHDHPAVLRQLADYLERHGHH